MPPSPCSVAAVHFTKGMDVDRLLLEISTILSDDGLTVGGLVQVSTDIRAGLSNAVHVVDLLSGDRYNIWEPRGRWASGCRLDENGLAAAEASVLRSIDSEPDLVLLNRFGRAEAKGRGLINCFALAMAKGVPILTAVRDPFDAPWSEFHGGMATALPADVDAVITWVRTLRAPALMATIEVAPGPNV